MTPQLQQAIKLLQLSNLELADYVETELERNPLLERTGDGEGEAPAASAAESRAERDGAAAAESGGADWQGDDAGGSRAAAGSRFGAGGPSERATTSREAMGCGQAVSGAPVPRPV